MNKFPLAGSNKMKGDGIPFPGFITVSSTWESWQWTTHQAESHEAVKPTTAAGGSCLWSSVGDKHLQWFHGWWLGSAQLGGQLVTTCFLSSLAKPEIPFPGKGLAACVDIGGAFLHSHCSANTQFGGYLTVCFPERGGSPHSTPTLQKP